MKIFEKKTDLLILDTLFPHPLSPFRLEEFREYLKYFNDSQVLSTGDDFPAFNETKKLKTIIREFEIQQPEFKGRTRITGHEIIGYQANSAYLLFLNNVKAFLSSLEARGIPFVFT